MAGNEKGCVKVADNLYRRPDSPNLYIVWHQSGRKRWKSITTSLVKEAKRLRDEFLARVRASGLTRDERVTYEQIRQVYVDHCTVRDRAASLETFLDTRGSISTHSSAACGQSKSPRAVLLDSTSHTENAAVDQTRASIESYRFWDKCSGKRRMMSIA